MPELAEVETLRRGFEQIYVGRTIVSVALGSPRSTRRHRDPADLAGRLAGRRVTGAARKGKYLVALLDGPDAMVAHMGMSGQLLTVPAGAPARPHTHAAFTFDGGPDLHFVDPRTFGQIWVAPTVGPRPADVAGLEGLGPDPIEDSLGGRRLAAMLAARRTRLKPLLMDQRFVAGIGNMYADEILYRARLHQDRPASGLAPAEVRRLHRAIGAVLREAIEYRGSSLADEQYRDLFGELGAFQKLHRVYGRAGSPCPRCRAPIVRAVAGGRSSFFCPACQPSPNGPGPGR